MKLDGLGTSVKVTVSIGVAAYPESTTAARDLLLLADEALYRAKAAGRNRVEMSDEATNVMRIGKKKRAIARQATTLFEQRPS